VTLLSQISDIASGLRQTTVLCVDNLLAYGNSIFKAKSFVIEEVSVYLFDQFLPTYKPESNVLNECSYLTKEQPPTSPLDKINTDMRHLTTGIRSE